MAKSKWRFYLIFVLFISAVYVIAPSITQNVPYWLSKVLPENKLRLGLDLKGGVHLVLGANTEKVLFEYSDKMIERLKEVFEDKKIDVVLNRVEKTSKISIKHKKSDEDLIMKTISDFNLKTVAYYDGEIVFDMDEKQKDLIKKRAIDQSIEAIRNRIDEFGVSEPSIQAQGVDRVLVQLPGIKDPSRAKSIIGRTARLEFKLVLTEEEFPSAKLLEILKNANDSGINHENTPYYQYIEKINEFAKGKIPETATILFEKKIDEFNPTDYKLIPYLLEKRTLVTGDYIDDANVTYSNTSFANEPSVSFSMNPMGAKYMGELTGGNIGRRLAIVLDNNVYSAPVIQAEITTRGQITLGGNMPLNQMQKEANDIALVLRAGALPTELVFEEERTVGPTLGKDSIEKGTYAMMLGFLLVVFFMLFYYKKAGLVADISVILNVLFITAILILFDATLTLPGIAGIILTVGMSVDANIIIYERIRDELRSGNSLKSSIEAGFGKALSTILDANITTAIAAIVLLQYGTGPIRGFAVTLLIGIFSSVFTAIYVSKWLILYFGKNKLSI